MLHARCDYALTQPRRGVPGASRRTDQHRPGVLRLVVHALSEFPVRVDARHDIKAIDAALEAVSGPEILKAGPPVIEHASGSRRCAN